MKIIQKEIDRRNVIIIIKKKDETCIQERERGRGTGVGWEGWVKCSFEAFWGGA